MNLGYMVCGIFDITILAVYLFFALTREKGANFISGFSRLSKNKPLIEVCF